jgi:hypothetical protein
MTIGFHRETATIYQFPVKGARQPNRFERARILEREAEAYCDEALDSCWYHHEAVSKDDKLPNA